MKFNLIEAERANYPVTWLCRILEVSSSHFYRWRNGWESKKEQSDTELLKEIEGVFSRHDSRYGARRIVSDLSDNDREVGRYRVSRLMKENGLVAKGKKKFRVTTNSNHQHPIAENILDRNFTVNRPDKVWSGDITYLETTEGWLYLAVVLDLYSRKVVGWSMGTRINKELCLSALDSALGRRKPTSDLLHHSDRGSQYTSYDYQEKLEKAGISCSMSRRGNCWDNSVVESFFATLKRELFYGDPLRDREGTADAVFRYIEIYYNQVRKHSYLGYLAPTEFERRFAPCPQPKLAA